MGASWGSNDTIVFATNRANSGLRSVPAGGGEPKTLTTTNSSQDEVGHVYPSFLPGGRAVLFTIVPKSGLTLDDARVAVLDLATGQRKVLVRGGGNAEYAESGHLVYAATGSLRAVRFDPTRLEVLGDPIPIVGRVVTKAMGATEFALSKTGTLVYVPGGAITEALSARTFVWVDRQGREASIKAPPRPYIYIYPRLSPDGAKVAVEVRDRDDEIWIWDFAHEVLTRLTFDPATDSYPVWAADGRRVLFASARDGVGNVFAQQADNTAAAVQLTNSKSGMVPSSVSPDGKFVALRENVISGTDVTLLHLTDTPKSEPLLHTKFGEANAEISPDGHWIAYQSNESGANQIYVRPFPDVEGGRWQLSSGGGTRPVWARSGRELFFLGPDAAALMAVSVQLTPKFNYGNPIKLFDTAMYGVSGPVSAGRTYDVSPDGQKFLFVRDTDTSRAAQSTSAAMTVVLNWFDELRAKVPNR